MATPKLGILSATEWFKGPRRAVGQIQDAVAPTALPSPQEILAANNSGTLNDLDTETGMRFNGCLWLPGRFDLVPHAYARIWRGVERSGLEPPPKSAYWLASINGDVTPQGAAAGFRRNRADWGEWSALWKYTLQAPGIGDVDDAFMRGFLSNDDWTLLRNNTTARVDLYDKLLSSRLRYPSSPELWKALQSGALNQVEFEAGLRRNGMNWQSWEQVYPFTLERPTVGEADAAFVRGAIGREQWERLRNASGAHLASYDDLMEMRRQVPNGFDLSRMMLRGLIDPDEFKAGIRRNGFDVDKWGEKFRSLAHEVPSISDLVRFQVREAMDPRLGNILGLYDERPQAIERYFQMLGYGWGPGILINSDDEIRPAQWSDIYWAAHWQPISPQQAYTMLHRLRPDRVARYQAQGFKVDAFTIDDVRRHLRIADYPKPIRDYLAAVAYTPMRLVDIKNRLKFFPGKPTEEWAIGQLQDRGYHPDDARTAVELFVRQAEDVARGNVKNVEKNAPGRLWKVVEEAYYTGTMPRDRARRFGEQVGLSRNAVESTLDTLDYKWTLAQHKAILGTIRRDYLAGLISDDEMRGRIGALDMVDAVRESTVRMWRLQRGSRRKTLAAKDALECYKLGLIGEGEAVARLTNLGYDLADTRLMVARANVEYGQAEARTLKAQEREREASARELERVISKSEAGIRRMQADLARMTPIAKLIKWAKEGRITEEWFRRRLRNMGYNQEAIDLHWGEVSEGKDNGGNEVQMQDEAGGSQGA